MSGFMHGRAVINVQAALRAILLTALLVLAACAGPPSDLEDMQADVDWGAIALASEEQISWREDVQPVLEQRCVVCHGCFDAPCQLKLTSYEGLIRGANPAKVYDLGRIKAAEPTRLYIDAQTDKEWREKGFHPVLAETDVQSEQDAADFMRQSVLYRMLRLKQRNPQPRTGLLPAAVTLDISRKQTCTAEDKVAKFERDHPLWGMPYGMPNLAEGEYATLVSWLAQGAHGPEPREVAPEELQQVAQWDAFLNGPTLREQLMGRYLYEHLFLGHMHFAGTSEPSFYRLVRSATPPGEPIRELATVRPFDDPGPDPFWYRLRPYDSSIVAKSHVIYEISAAKLKRFRELFLEPDYAVAELPGYSMPDAANPFIIFDAIPERSRFMFLLDDARFFIQGFIKGPVCRGQVALNVIEDQFWVLFANPAKMVNELEGEDKQAIQQYLSMPSSTQTLRLLATYTTYWKDQKAYLALKSEYWAKNWPTDQEAALDHIWDGDGTNPNAALTIFRSFDSAAVEFGLRGQFPDTTWIIDYPLLERIHYLLVAGYDVYGNVGHQLNSRLFMDFLRMEGEDNFLSFMPQESRQKIRATWYEGIRSKRKKYFEEPMIWLTNDSPINFVTDDPQTEFYKLVLEHLGPMAGPPDYINRCTGLDCDEPTERQSLLDANSIMRKLSELQGEQLQIFPELAFVRVGMDDGGPDLVYSLIVNRDWSNMTSFLENAEKGERDPSGDTLTVLRGFYGSYPNFFFLVPHDQLEAFVAHAATVQTAADYQGFVARFGVRRTRTDFWAQADWFQETYFAEQPVAAGIFDLNRYENR